MYITAVLPFLLFTHCLCPTPLDPVTTALALPTSHYWARVKEGLSEGEFEQTREGLASDLATVRSLLVDFLNFLRVNRMFIDFCSWADYNIPWVSSISIDRFDLSFFATPNLEVPPLQKLVFYIRVFDFAQEQLPSELLNSNSIAVRLSFCWFN